jgi:hypothetical protein
MTHFGWPEVGIVLAMLAGLVVQTGFIVAAVYIALHLWHRRHRVRGPDHLR